MKSNSDVMKDMLGTLYNRLEATGEELVSINGDKDNVNVIVTDDTLEELNLEYNFKLEIFE